MLSIGEKVVHSPEGVCVVEDICKLSIDKQEKEMYKLRSIVHQNKVLYISVNSENPSVRHLKSKEEILNLLQIQPAERVFLRRNINQRMQAQNRAIYQDDSIMIMRLIKLYKQKYEQSYLSVVDKNWLRRAEQYLFSEIAEVLGCEYTSLLQKDQRLLVSA